MYQASSRHDTIDLLYEMDIKDDSKVDQCFLFDEILQNIEIIFIKHDKEIKPILRYKGVN